MMAETMKTNSMLFFLLIGEELKRILGTTLEAHGNPKFTVINDTELKKETTHDG